MQHGGLNEVDLAVHPLDSSNLALAYIAEGPPIRSVELRLSQDAGATWPFLTEGTIPASYLAPLVAGDPVATFDSMGRLFWCYIVDHANPAPQYSFCPCTIECSCWGEHPACQNVVIAEVDPQSGSVLQTLPITTTFFADKPWLAADANAASPFRDRLYAAWVEVVPYCTPPPQNTPVSGLVIFTSFSSDHGENWSPKIPLSPVVPNNGLTVQFAHVDIATNGDVFIAYALVPPAFPGGAEGRVMFTRSADGGATWSALVEAFGAGEADITSNTNGMVIPGTLVYTLGSFQPWVLPDPNAPQRVFVVACDDPDNNYTSGDSANIYIVRSDDSGATWTDPLRVDHGPGESFALFPTGSIDRQSGCIAVMWYDNRQGAVNGNGHYLLDVYFTVSTDGGTAFRPDHLLSDAPLDPDQSTLDNGYGAKRIGEYNGVVFSDGNVLGAWTGNTPSPGTQIISGAALDQCGNDCPWDLDGDDSVGIVDFLALLQAWDTDPCGPPDFDGDGSVGIVDFLDLLAHWGEDFCLNQIAQAPPRTVQECIETYGLEDPLVLQHCICAVEPTAEACP